MKKLLLTFLLLTLAAPAWAGDDKDKESAFDRVMRTGTIRCGYFVWPPFLAIDPNTKKKSGIFFDIVEEMGKRLELKIEWTQELNFGTYIQDLETHKYDMECTGGWPTATRGKFTSYSNNLFYIPLVPFVKAEDNRFNKKMAINSPEITVVTIDGENSQIIKRQQFPKTKELGLPQNAPPTDMMMAVITGKADVAFTDMVFGQKFMEQNPKKIKPLWKNAPVKIIPQNFTIKPEESRFTGMINVAIEEMLLDGDIDRILNNYEGANRIFMRIPPPAKIE
ncbi:MAG: transporter substrate-binding domain-containing protein [Alphaproteobacteria bacterium]|nr:transporter substrate-binding domain-containing protein [Alphaproteobacteria bacterium]